MTTKKKQPKSAKTRLSDITPKNDARGGALPIVNPGVSPRPSVSASANPKKLKFPPPSA